jgi:hypothetical protein
MREPDNLGAPIRRVWQPDRTRVGTPVPRGTGGSTADRERARRSTPARTTAHQQVRGRDKMIAVGNRPGRTVSERHRVGLVGDPLAWPDRRGRTTDRSRIPNRSFATTNLNGKVGWKRGIPDLPGLGCPGRKADLHTLAARIAARRRDWLMSPSRRSPAAGRTGTARDPRGCGTADRSARPKG